MSFCAALMGGCKEAPAEIPVVGVEDVLVDNIEIYGDYVGLIKAASRVEINARVEGFLEKMTFEEGKRVRMNEPLFYINDDQYKARVEKAKAQLKKDEAQAAKAERDVQRLRPLYEQNAASQLDLDNAVAALDMARASVAMSKADLQQAELELSYTVVRSPLTGYISERYADIGSLVGKSNSTRLATVVKSDTVLVDFKLTALDYLRSQRRNVHLGELDTSRSWQPTVSVTLADNSAYGEKGIVDFASPQVDRDFRGACRIAQSAPSVVTGTVYAGQVAARRAGKRNGGTQEGDFNRKGRCVYFRRPARQYRRKTVYRVGCRTGQPRGSGQGVVSGRENRIRGVSETQARPACDVDFGRQVHFGRIEG